MVRPLMSGFSRTAQFLGTAALDSEEKDSGTMAFSALMYQYGGELDARVLVAMWVAGVTLPRALEYMDRKDKERKASKSQMPAVREEKEVKGESSVMSVNAAK